jgi:hypothetical protein
MAILARRGFKVALFIALFYLAVRYVHTYPWPMPENQALAWLSIANGFGPHDPDDVYIPTMIVLELITTVLAYVAIVKFWRWYQRRKATLRGGP